MSLSRSVVLSAFSLFTASFAATALADHPTYAVSILQNSYSPVNQQVMALIGQKNLKGLKEVLKKPGSVNVADNKGARPAHYAAHMGNLDAMKLFVSLGADVKATTFGGWTTLHYAVAAGHADLAEYLIAHGVAIDAKDVGGESPLFYGVESGNTTIAEWLIKRGANVNHENSKGETPLSVAKGHKMVKMIELLQKLGGKEGAAYTPDPNDRD
ncbi:MAG TPA: ankyrin repeat domain-containing protein [Rhodocyclaceae bacterium]|nr:ankyrin repeat domain-containing protein [Rhodocyclaceae bacterium]